MLTNPYAFANIASHPTLTNGLISYYKCDENGSFPDNVGSNTGTINGATFTSNGKIGGTYDYDGVNDQITLGTSSTLNPANLSINIWINSDSISTTQIIVARDNVGSFGVDRCYGIFVSGSKVTCELFSSTAANSQFSTVTLSTGVWHMITCTYDGSDAKIYIDGALDVSSPLSITLFTATILNRIGSYPSAFPFNGRLDENGYWNRALTAPEVTALYAAGSAYPYNF